jgi:hypothetical protein
VEVLGGSVPDQIAQTLARDLAFLIVDQDELDAWPPHIRTSSPQPS